MANMDMDGLGKLIDSLDDDRKWYQHFFAWEGWPYFSFIFMYVCIIFIFQSFGCENAVNAYDQGLIKRDPRTALCYDKNFFECAHATNLALIDMFEGIIISIYDVIYQFQTQGR